MLCCNLFRMGLIISRAESTPDSTGAADAPQGVQTGSPWRKHAVVLLVFVVLGFVFLLPGSLSPQSALLGQPGDNFQHAWFLWHFAHAITHAENPFYTRLLFYPNRVTLAWSTADPLAGLTALPLSLTAGPVVAYNVSLVLQLALAAFCAWLLCLRICRNEPAAFIGGLVFGFSSFQLAQALGHLSLITAFPFPLFVLVFDRIWRHEKPSWKAGAPLGLALLLAAFAHYNYVVLCLLFGFFWLVVDLALDFRTWARRIVRAWKPLAAAAGIFIAGFSPLLWMMVGNRVDIPAARYANHLDTFSADVLGFLIPSWNHVWFGHLAQKMDPRIFVAGYEGTVYVGVFVLALAAFGFWKGRARGDNWATRALLLALVFYFLSLGPRLHLLGHPLNVPGPAALFYLLPFAKFVSAPARFHAGATLCLAILSSLGTKFILETAARPSRRYLGALVIALLIIGDTITIPFPRSSIANPGNDYSSASVAGPLTSGAQACTLPQGSQRGTVLTFPLITAPYVMKSMWMQARDQGKFALVDGYLSYTPQYVWKNLWDVRILRSLMAIEGLVHAPIDLAADRETADTAVRELNLSAIVVYDSPQSGAAVDYLEKVFGSEPQRAGSCTAFDIGQRSRTKLQK